MSTHFFKISLCYDKKWEIKLYISVNIYCRLLKLGMSTHFFKISLCYDKKWEIKLCFSLNIYHRLPKLGMSMNSAFSLIMSSSFHSLLLCGKMCVCSYTLGNVVRRYTSSLLGSYVQQEYYVAVIEM